MIGLAANAGADWLVGRWLDRRPRDAPILAGAGLAIAAASFPATMLAAPVGWFALLAATFVFRIGYAAFDVPHNALLSRLATSPEAATRLSRGRTLGTGAATALVGYGLSHANGPATLPVLLRSLAGASVAGGLLLVPLLRRMPIALSVITVSGALALPWRFLAGSLIGIVALNALGKAISHLPIGVPHPDAGVILIWLTIGRTAAALLPIGLGDAYRGERLLGGLYAGGALIVVPLLWAGGWPLPLLLGVLLGAANLVGWALLPLLAGGPRSYGLYTMASKLALGAAGLGMTTALGARPSFSGENLAALAAGATIASVLAAALLWRPHGVARRSADRI